MQAFTAGKYKGIDVSHHNPTVDWNKVKASGIDFVYVKATEGVTYVDPMYLNHAKGAIAVGLPVGAYHFARPQNDPTKEAQHFVDQLEKINYSLLPVLDLEYAPAGMSEAQLVNWVNKFIDYVKQERKCNVILYTGLWFINAHGGLTGLENLPLWLALYRTSAPSNAGGWNKWTIWQYTEEGKVNGVSGSVDMNIAEDINLLLVKGGEKQLQFAEDSKLPLSIGSKGDLVKKVQERLNIKPADGLYGNQTAQDVKTWQSLHDENGEPISKSKKPHLVADGVVGEKTWNALFPPKQEAPKQAPKQPQKDGLLPYMVRLEADGKVILDTQIVNTLHSYLDDVLLKGAKEINIKKRDQ